MLIKISVNDLLSSKCSILEKEFEFSNENSDGYLTIGDLATRLRITLNSSEGGPVVIVNEKMVPFDVVNEFRLFDGDHVGFLLMLSGG